MVLIRKATQAETCDETAKPLDFFIPGESLHAFEEAQYAGMLRCDLP